MKRSSWPYSADTSSAAADASYWVARDRSVAIQSPVVELADRFWQWFLARQPMYATVLGDERYSNRLSDPSAEGRAEEVAGLKGFLSDAREIGREDLSQEDTITLDMLEVVARIWLRQHEHNLYHFDAVDQMGGPQNLPGDMSRFQRLDTPERLEAAIERLQAFPGYLATHRANLLDGIAAGRTAAAPVVARVIEQTKRAVNTPIDQSPLLIAHPELDDHSRARLREAIERNVVPALADHLAALEGYAEFARKGDGIWALPDGEQVYETMILASTTLEETPQAIHDYGLEQLESIGEEVRGIARELGFSDVASMRRALASEPSNFAKDGKEIVDRARRQIDKANAAAPRFFGRLPEAPCDVRAVEPYQEAEAPPAFYFPPAPDGSRGGIYFVNTYQPESRPLYRLATTTYHEATPGHHFQIAIESELTDLPDFRRFGSRLTGAAYAEGWGLYSERLAHEMGLFEVAVGATRHARCSGMARGATRRRHRHPCLPLEPRPFCEAAQRSWPVAARSRDRDGPLHHLAGSGARLHDRHARDHEAAPAAREARRRPLRPHLVPRRDAWPWDAATRDAAQRTAGLGQAARLT